MKRPNLESCVVGLASVKRRAYKDIRTLVNEQLQFEMEDQLTEYIPKKKMFEIAKICFSKCLRCVKDETQPHVLTLPTAPKLPDFNGKSVDLRKPAHKAYDVFGDYWCNMCDPAINFISFSTGECGWNVGCCNTNIMDRSDEMCGVEEYRYIFGFHKIHGTIIFKSADDYVVNYWEDKENAMNSFLSQMETFTTPNRSLESYFT